MTRKAKEVLKFTIDDLLISHDKFVGEFVQALIEKGRISQKDLDKIYSDLVHKWNTEA